MSIRHGTIAIVHSSTLDTRTAITPNSQTGNRLFAPVNDNWPRELRRLNAFARRNLSLITAQLVLVAPEEREVRRMLRCACNAQLCIAGGDESCAQLLTAPWAGEDRSAAE